MIKQAAKQDAEPTGKYVRIHGKAYKVFIVNFQGKNRLWSASYITQSGSLERGWFHASQFTDQCDSE